MNMRKRAEAHIEQEATVTLTDENLTTLMTIVSFSLKSIAFAVDNAGNVLDRFEIQARSTALAAFFPLFSVTADYTPTPLGILIGVYANGSGGDDLTRLGNGADGGFLLYPQGYESIRVQVARASGANTTLNARAGLELP